MTLCDPFSINFLATSAIKILLHLQNTESLPRENTILILLLRMLALGLSAWIMIDSQDFKEPRLDPQVVTKFLPALMSLMVDDQVRALHAKLPPDERESAITIIEHSGPAPETIDAFIQESAVASILAMYYTLHVARQKDRVGLLRILGVIAACKDDRAYEDPFLHSLIASLIAMSDEFANEDFCTVLFDEFLFAGLTRDNVTRHMLKMLWYVHAKLPPARLQTMLKALQPTVNHHENVHKLYESLQIKVGNIVQEPAQEAQPMEVDSPLKEVLRI